MLCLMMCLSDFVPDPVIKVYVGYAVTGLIAFHLLCSLFMMTGISLFGLKLRCRKRAAFAELGRQRKENKKKLDAARPKRKVR